MSCTPPALKRSREAPEPGADHPLEHALAAVADDGADRAHRPGLRARARAVERRAKPRPALARLARDGGVVADLLFEKQLQVDPALVLADAAAQDLAQRRELGQAPIERRALVELDQGHDDQGPGGSAAHARRLER